MQLKKVLIISPHFPPVNAADMHRVRQSLPYFLQNGWQAEVITVLPQYVEAYSTDDLLLKTIPQEIKIHYVKAWDVSKTRKLGLGSLSMRSYFFIKKKGTEVLQSKKFDLIYFSTTAFHVMALGPFWKKKFNIPFIIDMQDPWRSDFYLDKPKSERPPKFFIAYNIDKFLEAKTIPKADGIITVSDGYCETLMHRYKTLRKEQFKTIPFGGSYHDFEIMEQHVKSSQIRLPQDKINIIYIGRGGHDLRVALQIIFRGFNIGLKNEPELFSRIHFSFIGTSYAPVGEGIKTILPIAVESGVQKYVTEITDRIPYFETLFLLKKANLLVIPGSVDTSYTASKLYPYLLAEKPLLAVFHQKSNVIDVMKDVKYDTLVTFNEDSDLNICADMCFNHLRKLANANSFFLDKEAFKKYTAEFKTKQQTDFFDKILSRAISLPHTK